MINRDGVVLRAAAAIAWSSVELSHATASYRAGLEFADEQPNPLMDA